MDIVLPTLSLISAYLLGFIITNKISLNIPRFAQPFFSLSIGFISFTAMNYYTSLLFSFPNGVIIAQLLILFFEAFYITYHKLTINLFYYLKALFKEKLLLILLFLIGAILFILFNHHVLNPSNGDLYTGESTFGDLPFHLSTISQIAYGHKFPPNHPMYANLPLVYPYLINFFSAILVYDGLSLRLSIIIPGLLLTISLIGLIYDFAFSLTKNSLKSFLTVLLYFFNGGLGFYFFLKDYAFNLVSILSALSQATSMKEYSHLFGQNIQWANFLSRMIVPERSLLFGIPAGIIILRILFFRNTDQRLAVFDLILAAFLLSLMPLLHTHTVLAMAIILPLISLFTLSRQGWPHQLIRYAFVVSLAVILVIPHIPLFFNHLSDTKGFFKLHLWWMKGNDESIIWFWFKNTYLFIPLSLMILALPKIASKNIKILQICAFILLALINLALFSPYNWDNVKFLFWGGLFWAVAAASVFGYLLQTRSWFLKITSLVVMLTMVSSALLSIWREVNVKYMLFSKEAVAVGEALRTISLPNATFLTYKIHNSPVNNLAGREIIMGYPGLLWVHGINYHNRENDINNIYAGSSSAKQLIEKYGIDYIVVESYVPNDMSVNKIFLNQYPVALQTVNYTVYKVR